MAKIVFGGFASEVRKSLGDDVYTRGLGGNVIRTKGTYTDPQSPAQLNVREAFLPVVQAWSTELTQQQRDVWNAFAQAQPKQHSTFDGARFSGFQWFVRLNQALAWNYAGFLYTPPANLNCLQPAALTIGTLDVATQQFLVSCTPDPTADSNWHLRASPPLSPGITFRKQRTRWFTSLSTGAYQNVNVWDDYVGEFGWPVVGMKICLRAYGVSEINGVRSCELRTTKIAGTQIGDDLVSNGSFQQGNLGEQATDWILAAGNGLLNADDESKRGSRSGKTTNPVATDSNNYQTVTLLADKTYELTGWIKTTALPSADPGSGAALHWSNLVGITGFTSLYRNYPGWGGNADLLLPADDVAHDWTFMHAVFTTQGVNGTANLACVLGYGGNQSGTTWWDDIRLIRIA